MERLAVLCFCAVGGHPAPRRGSLLQLLLVKKSVNTALFAPHFYSICGHSSTHNYGHWMTRYGTKMARLGPVEILSNLQVTATSNFR